MRRGFKRVAGQRVPPNTVAYYHNLFRRDQPDLLKGMNGGKKKDHDYRDALVRRELNRDLGLLNSVQPSLPFASAASPLVPSTHGLLQPLDMGNPLLRQQQLRARVEQDLAVQHAVNRLQLHHHHHQQQQQQQQQQAVQQILAQQLATEQLAAYQSLGLGSSLLGARTNPTLSMLAQPNPLSLQALDPVLALQRERLLRGEQYSLLDQVMLLEQRQRGQANLQQEEEDPQKHE